MKPESAVAVFCGQECLDQSADCGGVKERLIKSGAIEDMILLDQPCVKDSQSLESLKGKRVIFAGCPRLEAKDFYRRAAESVGLTPSQYTHVDVKSSVLDLYDHGQATEQALEAAILAAAEILAHKSDFSDTAVKPNDLVLIIGSGLSGLTAAQRLSGSKDLRVDVAEIDEPPVAPGCLADMLDDPDRLTQLKQSVVGADSVALLEASELVRIDPVAGGHRVQSVEGRTTEYGTVVFAPECMETPSPETGSLNLSQTYQRISADTAFKGSIVTLLDWREETRPEVFKDALVAALTLRRRYTAEVTVLMRSARVAMAGLQEIYDECRDEQILFLKYEGDLQVENDFGDFVIRGICADTSSQFELVHPDRLIIPGDLCLTPQARRLSELLGLRRYSDRYSQPDSLWTLPNLSNREGVFVVGTARDHMNWAGLQEDANAMRYAVEARLLQGDLPVEENIAVVDSDSCVFCLTCVRVCPFGAMTKNTEERTATVLAPACRGCGVCAAECPAQAIELRNLSVQAIADAIRALT